MLRKRQIGFTRGVVLLLAAGVMFASVLSVLKTAMSVAGDNSPRLPLTAVEQSGGESDEFAAGKKVFEEKDCSRCHHVGHVANLEAVMGAEAIMMAKSYMPNCLRCHAQDSSGESSMGPDLATVGRHHSAEWLMQHVRNPRSHRPDSRMPSYEGQIGEDDLRALADYLESLR